LGIKIRKILKSGNYYVFVNHKKRRWSKKIGKSRKFACEVAKKLEAKLVLGDLDLNQEKNKGPTLLQYVNGWNDGHKLQTGWFEKVAKLALKNSTLQNYRSALKRHLLPAFGDFVISEIDSRQISDFLRKKIGAGMRSESVRNLKNCLSAVLQHAAKPDGIISFNPVRNIPVPKPENERIQKKEANPCSWSERETIESAFLKEFPRYYPLVFCGFRTGLRIGELIALQWQDLNFPDKRLLVQRNVTRGKVTTPKTASSRRFVRLTSRCVEVLQKHETVLKSERASAGKKTAPWVFTTEGGHRLSYGKFLKRVWNPIFEKLPVSRRTPHDLRHTYVCLRLSKGDSLAEVSKELGHSEIGVTFRVYYKWLSQESLSDIDELDKCPKT